MLRLFPRTDRPGRRGYRRNIAPPSDGFVERLENRTLLTIPLPPTHVLATGASATSSAGTWDASSDPSVTGYNVIERVHHVVHQPKGSPRSYDTYDLRAA